MTTHEHPLTELSEFLADVVMTGYYLAEPPRRSTPMLHDAEMKCLKIIDTFGPLQMHDVAHLMHVTKPRATQLIRKLQQLDYITCTAGEDHRVKYVSTTTAGTALVFDLRQKYRELAAAIEQRLGFDKTAELCSLLAEISPLFHAAHYNVKGGTKYEARAHV